MNKQKKNVVIRAIRVTDNEALKNIICTTLEEFDADKPNTAYTDYDTAHLFEAYQMERAGYYVAELNGIIMGGAGYKELPGTNGEICELQKLYILPEARGFKIGKKLIEMVLISASMDHYQKCYLESFENMDKAKLLYEKQGFSYIPNSLGNTGHSSCNIWMIKNI
jgi:putative acetyltransferase